MPQKDQAVAIVKRLREHGYQSYLAGGCVRDFLLGREPQDYDVTTDARPEEVRRLFDRTVPVGAQFGVVLVIVDGEGYEVATFRFDGPYLDGRRPSEVRYGTLEEDIRRRDFTINGMVYDPLADKIIDLVGGVEDLRRRRVRAIGDPAARFEEDRLRMIRAVRFAAALGFEIEPDTLAAIRKLAGGITTISWERIGDEVTRILTEGGARRGFELLDETGLLRPILPEIEALKGVEQSPDYHPEGDVFTHTLLMLGHLENPSETLAYGCLLHDIGKPACQRREGERITFYGHAELGAEMAEAVLKRLKRGRAAWERVAFLVRNHLRHTQAPNMRLSTLKRFLRQEGIEELLELTRIDALAGNGDLRYYRFCKEKLAEFKEEEIRPAPLLRGADLIEMGFEPGPLFSEILGQVEERQLSGELATREAAVDWVRRHYKREVQG
ncbi:MAG TPA: CCA tRNA nucleotidyltransferase [candidate division Zixibacteria bacterium]|nr:CCA tRNA nucleotidyltransferase [candidate division Zixibacteria bacterium]